LAGKKIGAGIFGGGIYCYLLMAQYVHLPTNVHAKQTDRQTDRPLEKKAKKSREIFRNAYPPPFFQIVFPAGWLAPNGCITQKFSIFDKKKKCQTL